MKYRFSAFLLLSCIFFVSCVKSSVAPEDAKQDGTKTIPVTTVSGNLSNDSTLNVKGYLRVKLAKDSINTDDMIISFNPSAKACYVKGQDAPYFPGFGMVSLSSLSSDNVPLAINVLPLTSNELSISLKVTAKTDGIYQLKMDSVHDIPETVQIWLKDSYKNDSLDFRHNHTYAFNILKADTNSSGCNRFKLVLHEK